MRISNIVQSKYFDLLLDGLVIGAKFVASWIKLIFGKILIPRHWTSTPVFLYSSLVPLFLSIQLSQGRRNGFWWYCLQEDRSKSNRDF